MGDAITTEQALETLRSNPEQMKAYIKEHMEGILGDEFQQKMKDEAVKLLGSDKTPASRIPLVDPASIQPNPGQGIVSSWLGGTTPDTALMRQARALNEKFNQAGYKAGFAEFLRAIHPKGGNNRDTDERLIKVLGESQGDQGGFLVPETYASNLLSQAVEMSIVRGRAFVMPMGNPTVRIPAIRDTSHATTVRGGIRGYWTPESGSITASEPTFSQVVLTAAKLGAYTSTSNELLADNAVGLEALLSRLFPEAIGYFEDDAFINGNGVGQPLGILNADALVTVAKETGQAAATIVVENLDKMWARLLPSSKRNAIWIGNPDLWPQLAGLSRNVGTGGGPVFMANVAGGPPSSIYGRPYIETEKAQTLGTAGDLYLVDLSYYVIGDRQAITMMASPHVRFQNDETVFRFIHRVTGRPWLDSALTPRNGTNTLSPFINLATRA